MSGKLIGAIQTAIMFRGIESAPGASIRHNPSVDERATKRPAKGMSAVAPFAYIYYWNRQDRKGQFCRVTARGKMNSCCCEFPDGYKMITSRNALRKRKEDEVERDPDRKLGRH